MAEEATKTAPKRRPDGGPQRTFRALGPERLPRGPKTPPRGPHEGPRGPERPPGSSKRLPRGSHEAPKMLPICPQTAVQKTPRALLLPRL
eukprot:3291325-Pyramimonas_sp.AAC.1